MFAPVFAPGAHLVCKLCVDGAHRRQRLRRHYRLTGQPQQTASKHANHWLIGQPDSASALVLAVVLPHAVVCVSGSVPWAAPGVVWAHLKRGEGRCAFSCFTDRYWFQRHPANDSKELAWVRSSRKPWKKTWKKAPKGPASSSTVHGAASLHRWQFPHLDNDD